MGGWKGGRGRLSPFVPAAEGQLAQGDGAILAIGEEKHRSTPRGIPKGLKNLENGIVAGVRFWLSLSFLSIPSLLEILRIGFKAQATAQSVLLLRDCCESSPFLNSLRRNPKSLLHRVKQFTGKSIYIGR
jgi:hypothetical protein